MPPQKAVRGCLLGVVKRRDKIGKGENGPQSKVYTSSQVSVHIFLMKVGSVLRLDPLSHDISPHMGRISHLTLRKIFKNRD